MQDNTNVQPSVVSTPSKDFRSKGLVIVLALSGVIVLTGIVGVGVYMFGKSQGKKEASKSTIDKTDTTISESNDTTDVGHIASLQRGPMIIPFHTRKYYLNMVDLSYNFLYNQTWQNQDPFDKIRQAHLKELRVDLLNL